MLDSHLHWHRVDGKWYHVLPTSDGNVYVDGELAARDDGKMACVSRCLPAEVVRIVCEVAARNRT